MPYIIPKDRNQLKMYSLNMLVDEDSIARIIDTFVDSLDLESLGITNAIPAVEGRPSYSPKALLKLFLYGYQQGIRSSRKLAKACHVNLEVQWMLGEMEPDFRTISDFRKDNVDALKEVYLNFTKRFMDLMTGFFSVDGSKFVADNSKEKNFTTDKLEDRIEWLTKHIEEYMRQMEQLDQQEETSGTLTMETLNAKLSEAQERLERYQAYRQYMLDNNLSQVSLTDVDAKLMKNRNGFTVSHNVQTMVESETHMVVDFNVTSSPTDYNQLEPTAHDTRESNPEKVIEVTADKGYQSVEDMAKCLENGIMPHVILPDGEDTYTLEIGYKEQEDLHPESTSSQDLSDCLHAGVIPDAYKKDIDSIEVVEKDVAVDEEPATEPLSSPFKDKEEMKAKAAEGFFVRDVEANVVYCPAGVRLHRNTITKKGRIRFTNKTACKGCPYRDKCCKAKKGYKEVEFNKDEFVKPNGNWMKANGENPVFTKKKKKYEKSKVVVIKLRPDREKMSQRMCLSEHPFGTMKRTQNSGFFLLRGNRKVRGEFALICLAYNLKRAINLVGFEEIMKRMASSFCSFLRMLFHLAENERLVAFWPGFQA